jgi:Uncharacterized protein conserved in bacteria (DUF2252)
VKRLAASFMIAGRSNRFSARESRAAAAATVASYRKHMAEYAGMPALQAWYSSVEGILENIKEREMRRFYQRMIRKEERRDTASEFVKLARGGKGASRIKDAPLSSITLTTRRIRSFGPSCGTRWNGTANRCRTIGACCSTAFGSMTSP